MSRAGFALVLVGSLALADPPAPARITGTYHSNWDDVTLTQHGTQIVGTYVCCGGGIIRGNIDHGVIHYRWKQAGGEGRGVWTIGDGRLDGTWGVDASESNGGRWDLTRGEAAEIARP
jgi:hypothetical protein